MRVCSVPGCPALYPANEGTRCATHRAAYERTRGTRQERGYNADHDRERARLVSIVAGGNTLCARCRKPITPGEPWDLGHNDARTTWTGPEHSACNRADGGSKAHH